MSDDIFETDEEAGLEDEAGRRGGLLSGLAIQILKWVAIMTGAIIFVVTVVVVTLSILQSDEPVGPQPPVSEEYAAEVPQYDFYAGVGEIRGNTADGRSTFIADIQLGYDEGDTRVQAELSRRTPQIRDRVRKILAESTTEELRPQHEDALKQKMRDSINAVVSTGRVREVVFNEFQVVPF